MAIYDGKRLVHRAHITESEDIAKQDGQIVDSIVRNLLQGEWDTISAMEADLSFVKEAKADQVVIDALVHVLRVNGDVAQPLIMLFHQYLLLK